MGHSLPQTAQKLEDGWSGEDVKVLNKLVVKVNASKPILVFRPVSLAKLALLGKTGACRLRHFSV